LPDERAIWYVIAAQSVILAFLLLAVLGAMREIVILRGDVKAFRDLVQRPPAPSFVHDGLPPALANELSLDQDGGLDRHLIVFLSPGCQPCQDLAEGLRSALAEGVLTRRHLTAVVWAFTPEEAERYASGLPFDTILDGDGKLARACEVRATPSLFLISTTDYRVLDYSPEGSTQWVINSLFSRERDLTTAGS